MSKLWGGRFSAKAKTDKLADKFSFSIEYDYRLAKYDVVVSIAHAQMLGKQKIISTVDSKKIVSGLQKIGTQIDKGTFQFNPKEEDIHSNIQTVLKKMIGSAADKLHTARSRNDLIATDMRLYCMEEIKNIIYSIKQLQKALVTFAENNQDVIIPAYTHLQAAQVVTLAHHLLAYVEMLERDCLRLLWAGVGADSLPLGSCALSGTSLPIDREFVAKKLGFNNITQNSIDGVSDRDFIVDLLSAIATLGMHYSRICEDMILWVSAEFDYVRMDSSLCTGSSIMPHKKNPDITELIRGETAALYSNLQRVLVLMKGLPLTYNRDMQLDKPPLFESVEKAKDMTELLTKLFLTLKVNKARLKERVNDEYFLTVDIMDYLIQKGISYRDAHDLVGKMVRDVLDAGKKLSDLSIAQLKKYSPKFEADVKKVFNPQTSVKIKKSFGSTNPSLVAKQIKKWKKVL